jgi:hypothetical protein
MGMRVLHVSAVLIETLLRHGTRCSRPLNVPLDLEVLDVRFDLTGDRRISLVVRSGEWEELPLRPAPNGRADCWLGDRLRSVSFDFAAPA